MQKCIDGFSDIDECKGNHSCHVNAICTNTKGLYVCTCHPGYTGNGRDCTGIWCVSFVTIFIRKKSTIIVIKLVLPVYLVLKRDECRPEDNIDDDTIVLNKHSGEKKTQLAKEDLMDGVKTKVSKLMLGNFFPIAVF